MQVLKHPTMPSFEGAAPDLTGLEVLVFWDKDKEPEIVKDTSKFTVFPPIAYVTEAGEHEGVSPKGRYGIQYTDSWYDVGINRENVYIPTVIAVDPNADDDPEITGKIVEAYEDDEGVNAGGLKFKATYVAFPPDYIPDDGPISAADWANWKTNNLKFNEDSFYFTTAGAAEFTTAYADWPEISTAKQTTEQSHNISGNKVAWNIEYDRASPVATYLADLTSGNLAPISVGITNFYYIESFTYDSGAEKIKPIAADNADFNGVNANVKWLEALYAARADLKFTIRYHVKVGAPGDPIKEKRITMDQYWKAAYTVGNDGNARASLPIPTGNYDGAINPLTSVTGEYDLALRLFYYDPLITGGYGAGVIDDLGELDATASGTYLTANVAIIPITSSNLIWTYRKVDKARISQDTNDGEPIVLGRESDANKEMNLYDALKTHWKLEWLYAPNDTISDADCIKVPASWPARLPVADIEFDDLEEGDVNVRREFELEVAGPPSVSGEGNAIPFAFWITP